MFTLLPLGDEVHCAQASMHPDAILLPLAVRLESEPRVTSYSSSVSGSIFASGSLAA